MLLQILEDGRLTDSHGKVNFKNTIIIMTSNIGSDKLFAKRVDLGFNEKQNNNIDLQKMADELKSVLDQNLSIVLIILLCSTN